MTKPLTSFLLSFHYYHLIVNLDAYIFKCKVHFSFRPYISTLILGKPENNCNDLWPLGYGRLVLRRPQVHIPGFYHHWHSPAGSVELSDSPACRLREKAFPVEVKITPKWLLIQTEILSPNKNTGGDKIKHCLPDRCRTSKARTRSSPTKEAEVKGLQQRRYLQLPLSAH